MTETKHCPRCDTTKPLSDFNKNAARPDGKCTFCRDCMKAYYKSHYERNKDGILKHKAKFFQENKGRIKLQQRIYKIFTRARTSAMKLEALTAEDFSVMSPEQRQDIAMRLKAVLVVVDSVGVGEVRP